MIYTDREVRLFRGVVTVIAFVTLGVAGLTYLLQKSTGTVNTPEILGAIILALILYGVGEWLLPVPLNPARTPRPQPAPPKMRPWRRDPPTGEGGEPAGPSTRSRRRRSE